MITGIQQVGIGNTDAKSNKVYYSDLFNMNALVFEERAEAALMKHYTGNEVHSRIAALTLNMDGGGGLEIWQFNSRQAQPPSFTPMLGDTGIFAAKMKAFDIEKAHAHCKKKLILSITPVQEGPTGKKHFWLLDKHGNIFNVVEEKEDWFTAGKLTTGGVTGAVIGVSDIEKALVFYKEALGISEVVYDTNEFNKDLPEAFITKGAHYRRVLLRRPAATEGAFSELLGGIQIELVQSDVEKKNKIFANRMWGDLGFIHLCFDETDMDALQQKLVEKGFPFTVDSGGTFNMEGAGGRFSYAEDPDGTLIEFVETHKVPILKSIGWYLNLKKRKGNKPLPRFMIKALGLSKVS